MENYLLIENKRRRLSFILLFIFSLMSFISFLYFEDNVYPEININLEIDRKGANQKSIEFLKKQAIDVNEYRNVTKFFSNDSRATFLEKSLGAKDAGILMGDEINVWGFQSRFFIPSEQEEYRVSFDNKARFLSYSHIIPEGKEGGILEKEDARLISEAFIANNYHEDLKEYVLVESDVVNQEKRRDYSFTWEHNNLDINGAKKRIVVGINGDEVGFFNVYLKVPEEWVRDEMAAYSENDTTQEVTEFFTAIFIYLPMIFIFVLLFKKRKLQKRFALIVGIVVSIISVFLMINSLPTIYFKYSTLESWSSFLAHEIFGIIVNPIMMGVGVFLTVLVSEAYFRVKNPTLPALNNIFSRNLIRNKKYLRAIIVGFLTGFILLAYQVFYYYFGLKIGYWVPVETVISGKYFGLIPWIIVLSIGLIPAISEEMVFRLFGINFFKTILKKTWLAVFLSSAFWAFLHSGYSQQPFFARGIELLPVGIVLSYLYLNFGIVASIVAHFTMNSFLSLQILIKTSFISSAFSTIVFLLPVFLILIIFLNIRFRGEKTEEEKNLDITERVDNKKKEKTEKGQNYLSLIFLDKKIKYFLIFLGGVGFLSFLYMGFKPNEAIFEKPLEVIKRSEIIKKADRLFEERGYNYHDYKRDVSFINNFYGEDYLLDLPEPKEAIRKIYRKEIPGSLWRVKYFKPKEKENFYFTFLNNGDIYAFNHVLPETAEGESLGQDEALLLVEENLKKRKDINFSDYELDDVRESKKDNRIDYSFVYKNKHVDLGEGSLNLMIKVKGNEVLGFNKFIDIPESWARDELKSDFKDFVLGIIGFITGILLIFYTFYTFLKMNRNEEIRIKKYFKYSLIPAFLSIILYFNSISRLYSGYNGIESIRLFILKEVLFSITGLFFLFILISLLYSFTLALLKKHISKEFIVKDKKNKKKLLKDAILIGYALSFFSFFLSLFFSKVYDFLSDRFGLFKYLFSLPKIQMSLNDYIPLLTRILENIYDYFVYAPIILLALLILHRLLKKWKIVWLFCLVYGILIILENNNIIEIVLYSSMFIVTMFLLLPFVYFIKKNYLFLIIFIYVMELTSYFSFTELNIILWLKNIFLFFMLVLPLFLYYLYYKDIFLRNDIN